MKNDNRREQILEILLKAQSERLTEEDMNYLRDWAGDHKEEIEHLTELTDIPVKHSIKIFQSYDQEAAWRDLKKRIDHGEEFNIPERKFRKYRWAVAAILVGIIVAAVYVNRDYVFRNNKENLALDNFQIDSVSSSQVAELIFEDGTKIATDSMEGKQPLNIGQCKIVKIGSKELQISYNSSVREKYWIFKSGKDNEWKIDLPDGSNVWMNKESILRFPISYTDLRQLSLKGEAYFEVSSIKKNNKPIPFRITLPDSIKVEVLGTRFNVSAYKKQDVKTTLLEGSVAVYNKKAKRAILKPGQAAIQDTSELKIVTADTTFVLGWKFFNLPSSTLEELILKMQIGYGLRAVYGKGVDRKYGIEAGGGIDLNTPPSEFLRQLENTVLRKRIHFEIIDSTIYITKP